MENIPSILLLCMDSTFITAFNTALSTHFPTCPVKITAIHERLNSLPATHNFDLVVSPANSYGRLDGGFDEAISRAFCLSAHAPYHSLTRAVQRHLYHRHRGFLPPGSCALVPFPSELQGVHMNKWGCKWIAICPTMRAPMAGGVAWDREVVYECVWSLMCEVEGWNRRVQEKEGKIESILMTPLATGSGGVSSERWARQLVLALKHFVDAAIARPERWEALEWRDVLEEIEEVEGTWRVS